MKGDAAVTIEQSGAISNRLAYVDYAKGIAMLLVIVGHSLSDESLGRGIIYSFHMPLFFVLSTITCRFSSDQKSFFVNLKKSARHILIPAAVFAFLHCVFYSYQYCRNDGITVIVFQNIILALLFGSGADVTIGTYTIPNVGMVWFLFCMFSGRTLFDWLQWKLEDTKLLIACVILCAIGLLVGRIAYLPLCLDVALVIQPFFFLGKKLRRRKRETGSFKTLLISLIGWAILFVIEMNLGEERQFLEIAGRDYPYAPMCFFTAGFGSVAVLEACKIIEGLFDKSLHFLSYLGENSIWLLCVHSLDGVWRIARIWVQNMTGSDFLTTAFRIMGNCIILYFYMMLFNRVKRCRKEARG